VRRPVSAPGARAATSASRELAPGSLRACRQSRRRGQFNSGTREADMRSAQSGPTRGVVVRTRFKTIGVLLFSAIAVLAAAPAAQATTHVWTIAAMQKAFPTTPPGSYHTIGISAAGNEWEGAQIVVNSTISPHTVTFSWDPSSDPLLTANSTLQRVGYIHITQPTLYLGSKPGYYPDPLLPAGFDKAIRISGQTTSFYVLFHVPYGTTAGTYNGTINVTDAGVVFAVPVHLRVWGFGWKQLGMRSSLTISANNVRDSLAGVLTWNATNRQRVMYNYYKLFSDYGLSPGPLSEVPSTNVNTGAAGWGSYVNTVTPYLGTSGFNFSAVRLPFMNWVPWITTSVYSHASAATRYITDMVNTFKQQGWAGKAFVYNIDEPITLAEGKSVERMARFVHAASAKAGYRIKYLVTDDPRSHAYQTEPANTYLFDDIDIWCVRYFYFFDRWTDIQARQRAGKEIWWYFYANPYAKRIPTFVIDKGLADERAVGWMAYQWGVNGLLYYSVTRWGSPVTGAGYRDPYQHPVSFLRTGKRANGDAMFLYPGYEPSVGLNDPFGPPRSSLRLEAIRDGMEENEYLRLAAETYGPTGTLAAKTASGDSFARNVLHAVTSFTYNPKFHHNNQFPVYTTSVAAFSAARNHLGNRIERYLQGLQPLVARGTVVDATTGKPIAGAAVTDGVLTVHSHSDGTFVLSNVLPTAALHVSATGHAQMTVVFTESGGPLTVTLRRV
jgi:hypothetical protein